MKNLFLAITLFSITTLGVVLYPATAQISHEPLTKANLNSTKIKPAVDQAIQNANKHPKIEVVFVLDTTGSMSGLLQSAKDKIWSIATTLASAEPAPEISIGLVAYRDRTDNYVTKVIDLSSNLDAVFAQLMQFTADGGGDTPESVNKGLYDAINNISWSNDQQAYQTVFLVGDAPAHTDYENDVPFEVTLQNAKQKGIIVNSIQCGNDNDTRRHWQRIASLAGGDFLKVEQNGSAIASDTPYDSKLAKLAKELESTRIYYGSKKTRDQLTSSAKANDALYKNAPKAALAKRAEYNNTRSGARNLLGENELLEAVAEGKVDLATVDNHLLPEAISSMAIEERSSYINEQNTKRAKIKKEMLSLSEKRKTYVQEIISDADNLESSLDYQLFDTLKKQAKAKGIDYEEADLTL